MCVGVGVCACACVFYVPVPFAQRFASISNTCVLTAYVLQPRCYVRMPLSRNPPSQARLLAAVNPAGFIVGIISCHPGVSPIFNHALHLLDLLAGRTTIPACCPYSILHIWVRSSGLLTCRPRPRPDRPLIIRDVRCRPQRRVRPSHPTRRRCMPVRIPSPSHQRAAAYVHRAQVHHAVSHAQPARGGRAVRCGCNKGRVRLGPAHRAVRTGFKRQAGRHPSPSMHSIQATQACTSSAHTPHTSSPTPWSSPT